MQQRKTRSLVERKNSWRPFLEGIRGALRAKDFRKVTVSGILKMLDEDMSFVPSPLHYLGGTIIGCGFPLGRQFLYGDVIERFLARNRLLFKEAPLPVISEFNKLLQTLFPHNVAHKYLLEESMARKRLSPEEKIMIKGKAAQARLEARIKRLQGLKVVAPPVPEEPSRSEPEELAFDVRRPHFHEKISLDERTFSALEKLQGENVEITEDLVRAIEGAALLFGQFVTTARNSIPQHRLGPFQELTKSIQRLPSLLFFDENDFLTLARHQEGAWSTFIENKLAQAKKPFEALLKRALHLKNALDEVENERSRALKLIEPFLKKKDVTARVRVLLNELKFLEFKESFLAEKTETIEEQTSDKKVKIDKLLGIFQKEFFELILQLQKLEEKEDFLKTCIIYSRWEFFSKNTPYPDLSELIAREEKTLVEALFHADEELVIGEKSFKEISQEVLDTIYSHNVRLVRWEMLSRSLRLKDLRTMVEKELLTLDRKLSLVKLGWKVPETLLQVRVWLYNFLQKLFSPYEIFKDASDPESINVLFRYFWADLDRWRKRKDMTVIGPKELHALQTTLEIRDKIFGIQTTEQPSVEWLEAHDDEFAILPSIAQYSYTQREHYLQEVKRLGEKKKSLEKLARAIQAVKTFEPERIESLLEAFTLLRFPKDLFGPIEERLRFMDQTIDAIGDSLFCELGLLDTKSRMEKGYALEELVKIAQVVVPEARKRALALLESHQTDSLAGKIARILLENTKAPHADLFEEARDITLLLFHHKLLSHVKNPHSLARPLFIMILFQKLFAFFSLILPQEKAQNISELFTQSRKFFYLIFPPHGGGPEKKEMIAFLKEFSPRIRALCPDTEIPILTAINMIEKDLETTISWETPILTFIPGDLSYWSIELE